MLMDRVIGHRSLSHTQRIERKMQIKSILKPEGSMLAGLATVVAVYGVYQLNLNTTSQAHASDPNHPVLEASRKKAGWTSLILVAGVGLLARDLNVFTLGAATVIVMEL